MSLNHSPAIVTDGLVLCLDAANVRSYPKTGTTWTDLKGDNNGTLTNGPTFSSDNRGNIVFDGTNDSLRVSNDLTLANDFTITAFAKSSSPSSAVFIAGNALESSPVYPQNYTLYHVGGVWKANVKFTGSSWTTVVGPSVVSGEWIHLALVRSSADSNIRLYVNGGLYDTTSSSGSVVTTPQMYFRVGARATGASSEDRYFNGNISNVSVYNRSLTADEIRQNYEATVGRYV